VYGALDISASALTAQRVRLDLIAGNIANKEATTRDAFGNNIPYRRRVALIEPVRADGGPGIRVARIVQDPSPFPLRWAPNHPDAIKEGEHKGYLRVSNVNYHTEMVDAITAVRAYEANVTVMEAAKSMAATTLRLIT
jgi:flagellar basal-body rod protein FlgC